MSHSPADAHRRLDPLLQAAEPWSDDVLVRNADRRRWQDYIAELELERDDLKARLTAAHAQQQAPTLVGYMSPKQLPLIVDPEDESGVYMPMRKTPAGNFTLALYAIDKSGN